MSTDGKAAVGIGVGFALYMIISKLGLGAGRGAAGDDGSAEGLEQIARAEIERMKQLAPQPISPDPKPLLFRLKSGAKTSGKPILLLDGQTYQLGAALARVKLGRQTAVELIIPGDTLQGDVDATLNAFRAAGIEPSVQERRTASTSGNTRGQYISRGRW